jgi:hypothetical protein
MLYFKMDGNGKVCDVSEKPDHSELGQWLARHGIADILHANRIAAQATVVTGRLHIGVDAGASTWPRFDVVEAPKVGDPVSYAFNGDYYPDGYITHITEGTLRQVKTTTGSTYFRRKQSGSWVKGGTWSMVAGHRNERNPSF